MILDKILNAINKGKTTGQPSAVSLRFSLPAFDSILVDHPRIEGVKVIPGTYITDGDFRLEVGNALEQWKVYFNSKYSKYLVLQFIESNLDVDFSINFSSSASQDFTYTNSSITFKQGVNWSTYGSQSGDKQLLNRLIFGLGKILNISTTLTGSPMNLSFLNFNYKSYIPLTIGDRGAISNYFLQNYPAIENSLIAKYGVINSNTPLIYGCTNKNATNYNPEATADDGSCNIEEERVALSISPVISYFQGASEYVLVNTNEYYEVTTSVFGDSNLFTITDNQGASVDLISTLNYYDYPAVSLILTDNFQSEYFQEASVNDPLGSIQYFLLFNVKGEVEIFNSHGSKASSSPAQNTSIPLGPYPGRYFSNLTINYSQFEDRHILSWFDIQGFSCNLILDDTLPQLTSGGSENVNCESDTLSYGNVSLFNRKKFLTPFYFNANNHANLINNPYSLGISNGVIQPSFTVNYKDMKTNILISADNIIEPGNGRKFFNAFPETGSILYLNNINNNKNFIIPTIAGNVRAGLDLLNNVVRVTNQTDNLIHAVASLGTFAGAPINTLNQLNMYFIAGDTTNTDIADYFEDFTDLETEFGLDFTTLPSLKNTPLDINPYDTYDFACNRIFETGFSFDSADLGIYTIYNKSYSNGQFSGGDNISNTEIGTSLKEYGSLPVAIGNKLLSNSYYDNSRLSFGVTRAKVEGRGYATTTYAAEEVAEDSTKKTSDYIYDNLDHVGDFHLAIAIKKGFILTKINNTNFSILPPGDKNGLEVHVKGGKGTGNAGTPICMVFSPNDTFLYTILEFSSDKKIGIYNIHPGGSTTGCVLPFGSTAITDSVRILDNVFNGNLSKITLQADGSIYIWSSTGEYHKISNPDLLSSVEEFELLRPVYNASALEYFPSSSYKSYKNIKQNFDGYTAEKDLPILDSKSDINIYKQQYNSSVPTISIGSGIVPVTSNEFHSKILYPGYTHDIISNTYTANIFTNKEFLSCSVITEDTEDDNIVLAATTTKTENGNANTDILEYDGSVFVNLKKSGDSAYHKLTRSKNSTFIIPTDLFKNTFIVGYADYDATGRIQYLYKTISILNRDPLLNSYEYFDRHDAKKLIPPILVGDSDVGRQICSGLEVIKKSSNEYIFAYAHIDNRSINQDQGRSVGIEVRSTSVFNTSIKNESDVPASNPVGSVVHTHAENYFKDETSPVLSSNVSSVITVSKDTKFIAVSTSCEEKYATTISVHRFDVENAAVGTKIGRTLDLTPFMVAPTNVAYVSPIVKSIEFSPDNSKLYVLVGNDSESIHDLSASSKSRVMRLSIDSTIEGNETFSFDGVLKKAVSYDITNRIQTTFTSTNNISDAGRREYEENSNMVGLTLNADGNIHIINTHKDSIEIEGEDIYIRHIGGVITSPNSSTDSVLIPTAIVNKVDSADLASKGGSNFNTYSNDVRYIDQEDDLYDLPYTNRQVFGCTNSEAQNYNALATDDDGSCIMPFVAKDPSGLDVAFELDGYLPIGDNQFCDRCSDPFPLTNLDTLLNFNLGLSQHPVLAAWRTSALESLGFTPASNEFGFTVSSASCSRNTYCDCQKYFQFSVTLIAANLEDVGSPTDLTLHPWVPFGPEWNTLTKDFVHIPDAVVNGYNEIEFYSDFQDDYCVTCIDSEAPNFIAGTDIEGCIPPFCMGYETIDVCGKWGCTDINACNFDWDATADDGSCTYATAPCICEGADDYGGGTVVAPAGYCGSCDDPTNMFIDAAVDPGCDCDNNLIPINNNYITNNTDTPGYHCNCDGDYLYDVIDVANGNIELTPYALGCYCDSEGTIIEPDTFPDGICNCKGETSTFLHGIYCDCDGNWNTDLYCDCNTARTTYYKDIDNDGIPNCELESIAVCYNSTTEKYTDVAGTEYTAADLADGWTVNGPDSHGCEECASDISSPGGSNPLNCLEQCKYIVNDDGEVVERADWGAVALNDCGECASSSIPSDQCCDPDSTDPDITDACGSCIALYGDDSVKVSKSGDTWTITHRGETMTTTCNPCSNGSTGITVQQEWNQSTDSLFESILTRDDCNNCSDNFGQLTIINTYYPSILIEEGKWQGFISSNHPEEGKFRYSCNCSGTPSNVSSQGPWGGPNISTFGRESNNTATCCPGYTYDPCAYDGIGGCVEDPDGTYTFIVRDCNGECGGTAVADECGVCNGPGIPEGECDCAGHVEDCNGDCNGIATLDDCQVCGGDNSSCGGCRDESALNYDPTATADYGQCIYSQLTLFDNINDIIVDISGQDGVNFIPEFFVGTAKTESELQDILNNPSQIQIYNEYLGANVFADQPFYTTRCQIMPWNNILYIENPQSNAEITYGSQGIVQDQSYTNIEVADNPLLGYSAAYYFRLEALPELTTYNPEDIFEQHLDRINRIVDAAGNEYIPGVVNGIGDLKTGENTELSQPGYTVNHVYKLIPKINPSSGHPYEFSVDFRNFLTQTVIGCTDPSALNYNPSANQDSGNCEYALTDPVAEPVEYGNSLHIVNLGGALDVTQLKWIIYDDKNKIRFESSGDSFTSNNNYSLDLSSLQGCLFFLPVGFRKNDAWRNVNVFVTNGNSIVKGLIGGAELDPWSLDNRGSFIIKSTNSECTLGCDNDLPGILNTDHCVRKIKKDVNEFTNITLNFEVGAEGMSAQSNLDIFVRITDLDSGETLLELSDILESGVVYSKEFAIDKRTRLGVTVYNLEDLPIRYNLTSEFGEVLMKKTYN